MKEIMIVSNMLIICLYLQTTLAHIIASSIKQKGAGRFVTLSATSASVSDVREVIKQAQNELRLCKRKTVLFIDEIHRFNKSQQVSPGKYLDVFMNYICALRHLKSNIFTCSVPENMQISLKV